MCGGGRLDMFYCILYIYIYIYIYEELFSKTQSTTLGLTFETPPPFNIFLMALITLRKELFIVWYIQIHMKSSFPKCLKRPPKNRGFNGNAKFGDHVLEKSSSHVYE